MRKAIADWQTLERRHKGEFLLSVNISSKQLEASNFLVELVELLNESAFDPRSLQLEITESIFLRDAERMGALLTSIRALGIQIAFDDFGTGYSSLSYLERYPVDMLKIDQCFVRNLGDGHASAEVVKIIVRIAAVFGMKVAAEGVENEAQVNALLSSGCDFLQGYLYSKAVPLAELKQLLSHAGYA